MAESIPPPLRTTAQLMPSLEISAKGMSAQQSFLDVIARNIANAETTRQPDGTPYQRQIAVARGNPANGNLTVATELDQAPGRHGKYDLS